MSVSSCSVAVRDVHGYAYVRERFPETFIYRSVDIPDNPVCVSTECWLVADVTCHALLQNTIFIKDVIEYVYSKTLP